MPELPPADTPSPLSDSKSGRTLSPPAVAMHRQRSATLGAERSKENQHFNRSLHDDRDWVAKETGIGEHRDHSMHLCAHAHADSSAYYHNQAMTVIEIDFLI